MLGGKVMGEALAGLGCYLTRWVTIPITITVSIILMFTPGDNQGVIRRSVVAAWAVAILLYWLIRGCG